MISDDKLSIVFPAYNEEASIARVVKRTREIKPRAEIIVVDDGSNDRTALEAASEGAKVVRHPYNKGNGAAVKSGIRTATREAVLLLDADGQHSPEDIDRLLEHMGQYDLVIGARDFSGQAGLHRGFANWAYNSLASYLVEMKIPDLTSGFRCFKREKVLEFIHLLPNGYSYPTTTTMSFIKSGYNVKFVPIKVHKRAKGSKSKIRIFRDGIRFINIILKIITLFNPIKIFLPIAAMWLLLGFLYGLGNVVLRGNIPNGAVLLLSMGIIFFLVGLISEQIAALRFERIGQVDTQLLEIISHELLTGEQVGVAREDG
ncbi:MAG: glycosyltransferase family 2 protein [Chloroflexi bacterium]|uniref:Glycosyltransferase family 2 protein n=1 Tax=Candidatus Chlorohelix allophototropha TaxID=3003348 RepID=A0A8T7M6I4_9CHLR|nr:glycosyltransferase family 2 protein [Chloroflexota bacterium]WJW69633.1 glycosyltransferase family 2 protein [Chloroflexota bacterium L227-S17]